MARAFARRWLSHSAKRGSGAGSLPGRRLHILGPTGAGKTALLQKLKPRARAWTGARDIELDTRRIARDPQPHQAI